MQITQRRNGDCIEMRLSNGALIASLYDHHEHIIVDQWADTLGILEGRTEAVIRADLASIGLDVATVRMIDRMPDPSRAR